MSWIQSAFGSKISPVILFIIVVFAVVFFIAALLHLLTRFLLKQRFGQSHSYPEMSTSGAFQRQLQQLFHLHDSGLDQTYIDALPVFVYKDIMGLKEPFDCAVCLCEFSGHDKLRLLPMCSHAFHIDCIDTWLLSNSTCPLCRGVILSPGVPFENPVFYFEEAKETEDSSLGNPGFVGVPCGLKPGDDDGPGISERKVFSVRLGKFRSANSEEKSEVGETSNNNHNSHNSSDNNSHLDGRRCYSMGSFQYVVANSELQVALCPSGIGKGKGGGQIGNFTGVGVGVGVGDAAGDADGKKINNGAKGESFSVSKIWLWSKKGKFPGSTTASHYPNSVNVHLP